jgi:DNA-directed RNA polymerase specialized sigma24 family protein
MDCPRSTDDVAYSSRPSPEEERLIALVKRHYFALHSYANRRCQTASGADDVISQTFLFAWNHLDEVPEGDETLPWLMRVSRRHLANRRRGEILRLRVLDHLRQRGRDPEPPGRLNHPSAAVYLTDDPTHDWPPRQSGRLAGGPAGLPKRVPIGPSRPPITLRSLPDG